MRNSVLVLPGDGAAWLDVEHRRAEAALRERDRCTGCLRIGLMASPAAAGEGGSATGNQQGSRDDRQSQGDELTSHLVPPFAATRNPARLFTRVTSPTAG